MPPETIEIFRTGRHVAMSGEALAFADTDLAAIAAGYDPAKHEAPIVVGHPAHDAPAYGWISGVSADGGRLAATPSQVDPAFAELVKAGRFKKVSAAFYRPDSPNNPTPGSYYLRHVGFLGAQPPAIKGLKPVAFAEEDQVVVFGDWNDMAAANLFRSLRDYIIGRDGQAAADQALPDYLITGLTVSAAQPDDDDGPTPAPSFADPQPASRTDDPRAAELATREAAIAAREAALAEREAAGRKAELSAFLEGLRNDGRLLPVEVEPLARFMETLGDQPVAFAEGAEPQAPGAWLRGFLTTLPKRVEFGEVAKSADLTTAPTTFNAPRGAAVDPERLALHQRALAYQEAHPGTDYVTAAKAVEHL